MHMTVILIINKIQLEEDNPLRSKDQERSCWRLSEGWSQRVSLAYWVESP